MQASHAFNLREVNILEDPEAHQKFKEEIPVVFINGKKAFKYYLDENAVPEETGERPWMRGRPRACPLQGAHKGRPYVIAGRLQQVSEYK